MPLAIDRPSAWRAGLGLAVVALLVMQALAQQPSRDAKPRSEPAAKVERYAEALVRRYDQDADGAVSKQEWAAMQGHPASIDHDGDGRLTVDEVIEHIHRYSRQRSLRLLPSTRPAKEAAEESQAAPPVVPAVAPWRRFFVPRGESTPEVQVWFDDNDVDGDGQVTMSEFAPQITEVEAARFAEIDVNGDGVIVPTEYQAWLPPPLEEEAAEEPAPATPKPARPER